MSLFTQSLQTAAILTERRNRLSYVQAESGFSAASSSSSRTPLESNPASHSKHNFHEAQEIATSEELSQLRAAALQSIPRRRRAGGEFDPESAPLKKRAKIQETQKHDSEATSKVALPVFNSSECGGASRWPTTFDSKGHKNDHAASSSRSIEANYLPSSNHRSTHSTNSSCTLNSKQINSLICNSDRESLEEIESICHRHIDQFDAINISTALHRIAKKAKASKRKPNPDLLEELANRAKHSIKKFSAQGLSNIAWALATVEVCHEPLMRAIAGEVREQIRGLDSQHLANIAWAFGKLGLSDKPLIEAIAREVTRTVAQFNPDELSMTLYAFVRLQLSDKSAIDAVVQEIRIRIEKFPLHSLPITAWSLATLGIHSRTVMDVVARKTELKIRELAPHNLSNLAWAFSALGSYKESLMEALADEVRHRIDEFSHIELSCIASAYAKLNQCNERLMIAIAGETRRQIEKFDPQTLSITAWAFAKLSLYDQPLMEAIAAQTVKTIEKFHTKNLCNTAWTFATLGIRHAALVEAIAEKSACEMAQFTPQDLSIMAWAFTLLESENSPLLRLIAQTLPSFPQSEFSSQGILELVAAEHSIRLAGLDFSLLPPHWEVTPSREIPTISRIQRDVGNYLADLAKQRSVELHTEFYVEQFNHNIDFVLGTLAIEVDGPSHFAKNGDKPLGATLLRNRTLKGLGYELIAIPYWEWTQLRENEKIPYLERLMPLLSDEY